MSSDVVRRWLGVAALVACGCTDAPTESTTVEMDAAGVAGAVAGAGGTVAGADGQAGSAGGTAGVAGTTVPDAGAGGMAGAAGAAVDAGTPFDIPLLRPDLYDGPELLSQTGLYAELPSGALAEGVREYAPLGELWSDGATKKRWIKLPEGAVIDTSDMDDWVFPIDTRVFKEFSRDGTRIETRMVWKRGPNDWPMVAYIWNPEQTEAYAAPEGRENAAGTNHDVPDATQCALCHEGRGDRLLGTTALQLSHAGPLLTLDTLVAESRLSDPPAAPLALPGDADTQAALAYLHANCGHCHNPDKTGADRHISVYFWQQADSLAQLEDTVTYRSLVTDKQSPLWIDAVLERMADRGGKQQMPPLATEQVDDDGMAKVTALMNRLRQDVPALPARAAGGNCPGTDAVFQIFEAAGCRSSFCHGTAGGGLFWQSAAELHDVTIATQAQGDGCGNSGLARVEPGHPERSLLWLKLRPGPPCGVVMPPITGLTEEQIDAVGDWITGCTATP